MPPSPFRGLDPYGEEDADYFFGRERDVKLLVANLYASPVTLLYGPSGVGKSSVVQAGLVPALRASQDFTVVLLRRWEDDPVEALTKAVRDAGPASARPESLPDAVQAAAEEAERRVALVLDQFEDYFIHWERHERFAEELAEALERTRALSILVAIREESLAKLDRLEDSIPAVFENVLRLDYLGRDAARAAVVKALNVWNERTAAKEPVKLDKGVLDEILEAVPAGRPREITRGGLRTAGPEPEPDRIETAHLQLVLERLWEIEHQAGSRELRASTLRALEGPRGIVSSHVRDALDALTGNEQALAAEFLDRLVTPTGERIVQSTADLAGYGGVPEHRVRAVLDTLAGARILRPAAGGRWEIYHDVLAAPILEWRSDFVTRQEVAAQRRRDLFLLAGLLAAVLVLAGATLAVREYGHQRETVRAQNLTAIALRRLESEPLAAVRLALDAFDTKRTSQTEAALRATLARSFQRDVARGDDVEGVRSVAFAPDGRIVTGGDDGRVRIWSGLDAPAVASETTASVAEAVPCPDADRIAVAGGDGAQLDDTTLLKGRAVAIACSSDGRVVAVAEPSQVRVFASEGGDGERFPYPPASAAAHHELTSVALTRDGTRLAAGGEGGVFVWRRADGRRLAEIHVPSGSTSEKLESVAFSPDGSRLATGGNDGAVRVWMWSDGEARQVSLLDGHELEVRALAYSRDGSLLASASTDTTIRIWAAASGRELAVLLGHTGAATTVGFDATGTAVVSGGQDRSVRRWENPVRAVLPGEGRSLGRLEFGAGGRSLLTVGEEQPARVWDLSRGRPIRRLNEPQGLQTARISRRADVVVTLGVNRRTAIWAAGRPRSYEGAADDVDAVDVSRDGSRVVLVAGNEVRLVDVRSGSSSTIATLPATGADAVAFDGRARRIAVARSGRIRILDAVGRLQSVLQGLDGILDVAFSADGRSVLAAGSGGVRIWDARGGGASRSLAGHTGAVRTVATSAGSRLVLTVGTDQTVRVWDLRTGAELQRLRGSAAALGGDGRTIAVAGPDGAVRLHACAVCPSIEQLRARAARESAQADVRY